jgi:hypothetical protein
MAYMSQNENPRMLKKSWKEKTSVVSFLDEVSEMLCIKEVSDWYRISNDQIEKLGGRTAS